MRILALVSPAAFIRLIPAALPLDALVVRAKHWTHLLELLARESTAVAVVDPYWRQSASIHDLAALHRRVPLVSIVLYTTPHPLVGKLLPSMYRYGIKDCLFVGQGDGKARISRTLAAAARSSIPDQILMRLAPIVDTLSAPKRRAVYDLLHAESGGPSVAALAGACGVSTRHLLRWCHDAGLPSPQRLLLSARCAHALVALSAAGTTVADAADQVGRSRQTLHRHTRASLHATPRQAAAALVKQTKTRMVIPTEPTDPTSIPNRIAAWTKQSRDADT